MKTSDFLSELKEIDPRLEIIENPNRPGLSNIKLNGNDICPIPSDEIKDEPDPAYFYTFPNGMPARHNSKREAIEKVKHYLGFIQTEEGQALLKDD